VTLWKKKKALSLAPLKPIMGPMGLMGRVGQHRAMEVAAKTSGDVQGGWPAGRPKSLNGLTGPNGPTSFVGGKKKRDA
jgi:hypothetical protein